MLLGMKGRSRVEGCRSLVACRSGPKIIWFEMGGIMALFLGNSEQGWNWTKLSYHLPYTTIGGQTELAMHGYASALLHEIDISFWRYIFLAYTGST